MRHAAATGADFVKISGGNGKNHETMRRDTANGHFRGRPIDNTAARPKYSEATMQPPHRRVAATGHSWLNPYFTENSSIVSAAAVYGGRAFCNR